MVSEQARNRSIRLESGIEEGLETFEADERKIRQILSNLLSNAVKFAPDGGSVRIAARQVKGKELQAKGVLPDTGRAAQVKEYIEISVTDTGIGISREDQKRLFRPFEQLEAPLTKSHQGTGLGLALCKKLVELHGGHIRVESEKDKGSTFSFVIPRYTTPAEAMPPARRVLDPGTHLLTWEHVLTHLETVLGVHGRMKRKCFLLYLEVESREETLHDLMFSKLLKKTQQQHEIIAHGSEPGTYYIVLLDSSKKDADKAAARIRKLEKRCSYSATIRMASYPKDGESPEALLKALHT
jgi:anti-sigma regulatory factor (Ser/Thr protein kinase)